MNHGTVQAYNVESRGVQAMIYNRLKLTARTELW